MLFSILGAVISGLITGRALSKELVEQADDWFRLTLSLSGTAFVTFTGTWGASIGALVATDTEILRALVLGFGAALLSTAAAVLAIWKRSSLTRGIPILGPVHVEQEVLKGGFVYTEPANSTGGKR